MPTLAELPEAPDKSDGNARATKGKARRDWKPVFLEAYRNKGTVTAACKVARISRQRAYEVRETDEEFAAAWDLAEARTTELLEDTAYERALNGSDRLAEFMLKARRPKRYREHARIEGEATEEVSEGVNEEIEGLLAEVDRLTAQLADATAAGSPPPPGGTEGETVATSS